MSEHRIQFNDGAAYERYMGSWSRSAGDIFLDWLAPHPGLRWIDVGCGSGAFTARLIERCAPAEVHGIDPSEAQLAFAHTRSDAGLARFHQGEASSLPFPNASFDAATMALVIFFVPDPAAGVAEMVRVTCPGGTVAAYAWDIPGGGAPLEPIWAALRTLGVQPPLPPSADVSRLDALHKLWTNAGLEAVATREIIVSRTFADFDDFWTVTATSSGALGTIIASLPAAEVEQLRRHSQERLPASHDGRITQTARANAVKGRLPG